MPTISWEDIALSRATRGSFATREQRERWRSGEIEEIEAFVARQVNPDDPYECLGGES